jgi:hypothetical protein
MSSPITPKQQKKEIEHAIKHALICELSEDFTKVVGMNELRDRGIISSTGNGHGDRIAAQHNYAVIYQNGKSKSYSENIDDTIPPDVLSAFLTTLVQAPLAAPGEKKKGGNRIIGVYFFSKKMDNINRSIRPDILLFYKKNPCVVCGTKATACDHKNDLYNDPRVLDTKTQTLDDFQPLCQHCNTQKRQICKKERETGVLYSAKNIPQFQCYSFEFTWEPKTLDLTNPDCKKGTYWYDPIEFNKKIKEYMSATNAAT